MRFENVTVVLCSERVAYPIGSLTFSRANKNNSISADFSYKYEVGSSDYFTVLLSQSDIRIYVDVEDADIESLDKNGITGYFFEKDNLKYVCFDCDGCSFAVYGSLEEDELIKIAAGIAKE